MSVNHVPYVLEQVGGLTHKLDHLTPSDYVEQTRYLPPSVTRYPGPYRFKVNPYMREIVDCFDIRAPVREVNLMKGVQITYSTVAESVLLYVAGHLKTYPSQWLTADDGMAKKRLDSNIAPMFIHSGLEDILQSNDHTNVRKQAITKDRVSWKGGGYALLSGVQTGSKLRQDSIMIQLKDELDGWPEYVGKDGCPDRVSDDRCAAFWDVRKIFRGSTPLLHGTSKIHLRYLEGDQRKYFVRCLNDKCRKHQYLQWNGTDKETGLEYGVKWDLDDEGTLDLDSVRYVCKFCGHEHYEHDKDRLFDPKHGAEWRPTATPKAPGIRSYHLPALYSPAGMQPWHKSVSSWLKAWDVKNNRVKDINELQAFYNNVLGEPFEVIGDRVKMYQVSKHRRRCYDRGQIPNEWAKKYAGSEVGLLLLDVDVQDGWLAVGVWGFTRGNRMLLVDYHKIDGDTKDAGAGAWVELADIIENKIYTADDGKKYKIAISFIDAGYLPDTVYAFCSQYTTGVFPILGRASASSVSKLQEFSPYETRQGIMGFKMTVDLYKDRLSMTLQRDWNTESGEMPEGFFNAPWDIKDSELKELTVEYKRQKKNEKTGMPVGVEWYRPNGRRQELWDLMVYAACGLEVLAWDLMIQQSEREYVYWDEFWDLVLGQQLFYTE